MFKDIANTIQQNQRTEFHFKSGLTFSVPENLSEAETEAKVREVLDKLVDGTITSDNGFTTLSYPSDIIIKIPNVILIDRNLQTVIHDALGQKMIGIDALKSDKPKKLILHNGQSPGDIVMLTSAVRDLHRSYPNKFITDVRTPCPAIWENNPLITEIRDDDPEAEHLHMDYPLIHQSNQAAWHFSQGFTYDLSNKIGLLVTPTECKGDIYISDAEKGWFSQVREITGNDNPFWLIVSGGKNDYTAKHFSQKRLQQVVDTLKEKVQFVQIGEVDHKHPPLENVIDLRGKTDLRQLIRLVYHSSGIICPVTLLMHLAAAVPIPDEKRRLKNRPCIVIAGGREPMRWEAYTGHQYIHRCGVYACSDGGGCWKSRVLPIGDGDEKDRKDLCEFLVKQPDDSYLPKCLDSITAEEIINAVELYLDGLDKWEKWDYIQTKRLDIQERERKRVYKDKKILLSNHVKTIKKEKEPKDKEKDHVV